MSSNFIPSTYTGPPAPAPAPAPTSHRIVTSSAPIAPPDPRDQGLFNDYLKVPLPSTDNIDCASCRIIGGGTSLAIGTYAINESHKLGMFSRSGNVIPGPRARVLGLGGILLSLAGVARISGLTTSPNDKTVPKPAVGGGGAGESTGMLPKEEAGTPMSIKESGHAVA